MNQSVLKVVNNMKQHNTFKQEKKIKQLERKKKRNNKQKALLLFWNDEDSKPIKLINKLK